MGQRRGWLQALGPGLLFAAAAVGVSHLVQSTRAGAVYGLAMVGFVVIANLAKYPSFRFGAQYAAATGTSLLEGYRRRGRWALVLYAVLTAATMFTVQAAVTVVTAGLGLATFGIDAASLGGPQSAAVVISAALTVVCGGLLAFGRYRLLDRVTKGLVLILALSTLASAALVLPRIDWSDSFFPSATPDTKTIFFIAALVGWMPSAIDVSIWQSLWTLARTNDTGHRPTLRESMIDFHIGYVGTAVFALCFLFMGAGVMHGRGVEFASSAGGFAAQVIGLYTETLGAWSRPLIGLSAFAVMFSTTLTVIDGFPRALATLFARFRLEEDSATFEMGQSELKRTYWISLGVLGAGSILVLSVLLTSLKTLVDIATTLSFVTAPLLAWLNHRAVVGSEVREADRPRPWLVAMSWSGIAFLGLFALFYVYLRVLGE